MSQFVSGGKAIVSNGKFRHITAMSKNCCDTGVTFEGLSADRKRRLWQH
jgi:hypothetical protein